MKGSGIGHEDCSGCGSRFSRRLVTKEKEKVTQFIINQWRRSELNGNSFIIANRSVETQKEK
jgi:hypothetical protein